ncbi:rhomboid family intramembrane serine protease [Youhaiella tibetensis]|uniref:Rhomboid family intramembrane serine protease n=1 Tax=Paradevosia tibetensis TaxID=1447062 RepID=A0A5B9DQF5_9HYPH|nr:rhomboid family intramembrane serine protease [Youhaiella tibetensis]AKR56103.1 hypothetical protein XM25_09900 [Devosia sp. H5989]QEE21155.1 rhomboid family intramembrane serine protease [Youhaiella tibetensis]GGF17470.1 rhomboid family intramembrane serine protease [Youhaiella tibetensis]
MSEPGSDHDAPQAGREPIFMLPPVVTALAGIMLAIHLATTLVLDNVGLYQLTLWFGFIPMRLLAPDQLPGGFWPLLWTPFSHAFLHANWEHVIFNTLWLAIFATPVARRYGALPTLVIFLVTSAAGALAFAATTLPNVQVLIGASGGVAGLTGAAMRFIFQPVMVGTDPDTGQRVLLGRHLASLREVFTNPRSRNFSLIWIVLNAAVPLVPALIGQDIQIAWQAHLGGFVIGLLLPPLFERSWQHE